MELEGVNIFFMCPTYSVLRPYFLSYRVIIMPGELIGNLYKETIIQGSVALKKVSLKAIALRPM